MAASSLKLAWLALLGAASSACTVWNDVDVCEREPGPVQDVNRRTEGDQYYSGMSELVPSVRDTWLNVWASDLTGGALNRSEIRIGRLDGEGRPLSTCSDQGEATTVAASANTDEESGIYEPSLVMPRRAGDDDPLLFWGADDGVTTRLLGKQIGDQGCESSVPEIFEVHQVSGVCPRFSERQRTDDSHCLTPFRAAALDVTNSGGREYVLVWRETAGFGSPSLFVRVIEHKTEARFLPTALSARGEASPLLTGAHYPVWFDLVGLDDGRWAIAWVEAKPPTSQTAWVRVWNDRVEPLGDAVQVLEGDLPDTVQLDATRVGNDVGVVLVTSTGVSAIVASGKDGQVLTRRELPVSTKLNWVRMASDDASDTVAVSWTEAKSRVMVQLLSRQLSPKFNNLSCDSTPFAANSAGLAGGADMGFDSHGGLLLTWTSQDPEGDDRSGTAVRDRYYDRSVLHP